MKKKDINIRDQKLMQLLTKISSSQVKPRYYALNTFVGYTTAILKITLAFLAKM